MPYCFLYKKAIFCLNKMVFVIKTGKENAKLTLDKFKNCDKIIVEYNILLKKL